MNEDQNWEYFSKYSYSHTITLINQITQLCLLAVNNNIIAFHKDAKKLSDAVGNALQATKKASELVATLYNIHKDKTGPATEPDQVITFLEISERYNEIQINLFRILDSDVNYIISSTEDARLAAIAARDAQAASTPAQPITAKDI